MTYFVDLDGTLIDSTTRVHRLFCDLTDEATPIAYDRFWALKREGRSNESILRDVFGLGEDAIASFVAAWMPRIEAAAYLAQDQPFAFSTLALELLSSKGPVLIVTARQDAAAARGQVEEFGFSHWIDDVWTTGGKISKTELIGQRHIHRTPADVLVGDTGQDIQTARKLGIRAAAVLSGFRGRENLMSYGPDILVETLLDFAQGEAG